MQLAADGFGVDLFAPVSEHAPVINFNGYDVQFRHADFLSNRRSPAFFSSIVRMALSRRYSLFMANPVEALIFGAIAAEVSRTPLIVFSDELFTKKDIAYIRYHRRSLMNWAHRRAAFTIITDHIRASVLRQSTGLPENHTFYELPNSPSGVPEAVDTAVLRDRIGVPPDATMVLMSGYFGPPMGNDLLLNALPQFPPKTYLVFQSASRTQFPPDVVALCKLAEHHFPVRFLYDSLPYELVDQVIASCDIGVALYNCRGPNFELCGKGSGKLCRYLRLGKPVIVNHQGHLEWVARYGAGEIAQSPAELALAIQKISASYQAYSEKASQCYHQHFAFEKYYPPIHNAIRQLVCAN
jgi:glycosyltransferase involved in cell wall biosynthesis